MSMKNNFEMHLDQYFLLLVEYSIETSDLHSENVFSLILFTDEGIVIDVSEVQFAKELEPI